MKKFPWDYPEMSAELQDQVNQILNKEIDPIYRKVVERIAPEMVNSEYFPWLLAHKMSPEGCKVLLALPDPDWKEGMGEYEVTDEFIQNLGMDPAFVKKQLEESYYSGDVFFEAGVGPRLTKTRGNWIDLQNSRRWKERNGDAYYKIIGIMVEQEFSPLMEKDTDNRLKAGLGSIGRIVPKYDTVKDIPGLLPAENYMEILKTRRIISQNECACRIRHPEYKQDCRVCLSANDVAERLIKMEIGTEISWQDALDYLREAGKKEPFFSVAKNCDTLDGLGDVFCNCTANACAVIRHTVLTGGRHKPWDYYSKSRFRATIDIDKCIHCGLCSSKRCTFNAIQMKYYRDKQRQDIYVNEDQCMGCGCCVETCPSGALTMKLVDPPEALLGYAKDLNGNYVQPKKLNRELTKEEKELLSNGINGGVIVD